MNLHGRTNLLLDLLKGQGLLPLFVMAYGIDAGDDVYIAGQHCGCTDLSAQVAVWRMVRNYRRTGSLDDEGFVAAVSAAGEASASPDDIRAAGWSVAVHNDYRLGGVAHTFWLFTKDGRAVKGEGASDALALAQVRRQVGLTPAVQPA